MTHDEMIAVIQAHKEGKKLEWRHAGDENRQWVPVCGTPNWNFGIYFYRIAREPRKCWVKWLPPNYSPCLHVSIDFEFMTDEEARNHGYQLVTEQI